MTQNLLSFLLSDLPTHLKQHKEQMKSFLSDRDLLYFCSFFTGMQSNRGKACTHLMAPMPQVRAPPRQASTHGARQQMWFLLKRIDKSCSLHTKRRTRFLWSQVLYFVQLFNGKSSGVFIFTSAGVWMRERVFHSLFWLW